jgi:hypothetical protein
MLTVPEAMDRLPHELSRPLHERPVGPRVVRGLRLTPSMRTLGAEVVRGRWGRSPVGGGFSEAFAADGVAVLLRCTRVGLVLMRPGLPAALECCIVGWPPPPELGHAINHMHPSEAVVGQTF